eukprot:CAMPEP_0182911156 /NCGR_PEP_ID=MMETSP0034_2-20130328/36755_1 /TAXON_ID=156128 /ORGANISM="Nephroselmis pyriformis, Strain CCMP717" /LENGTH=62 /DNA_ID=CAMNT_0025047625 /DNA_START=96 /DNA_END=281 /DNA_ORIENTATION=+
MRAVRPSLVAASACAPALSSASTTPWCPFTEAVMRAVNPSLSAASTCAPALSSASTTPWCPS